MASQDDTDTSRRDYRSPYTSKHPIPTVQQYRTFKEQQRARLSSSPAPGPSSEYRDEYADLGNEDEALPNTEDANSSSPKQHGEPEKEPEPGDVQHEDMKDTSEVPAGANDPKQRRKDMKHRDPDRAEREVTDPVTHLPVTIRDFTDDDLEKAAKHHEDNEMTPLQRHIEKLQQSLEYPPKGAEKASLEQDLHHRGMERMFPAPGFQTLRRDMVEQYSRAVQVLVGVVTLLYILVLGMLIGKGISLQKTILYVIIAVILHIPVDLLWVWAQSGEKRKWDDEIWEAQARHERRMMRASKPESTKWLNRFLGSVWPLINPDLFSSLIDMLEDVMQASLPRLVRMVSVDDLGQGSEPLRILGIKWLPRGAAARPVSIDGQITDKEKSEAKAASDEDDNDETEEGQETNVAGGLEAEEGEFVNLEVAFAYRASSSKRKFKDREKNAHLYLAFYLPGGIKLPVWVELSGLVGTLRARLQLTPDPPFVALCTITFLGQPKVDLSCVPLVKRGLNIMDLPLISNFVQSAVDAAMSEYVAPKSLNLDLKAMLSGDDFKHDTAGRGVVIVRVKCAFDFKAGDASIPFLKTASSDSYVSVGWAKLGKPLFSTRVIVDEMHPYWQETTRLVVGSEEIEADESLRLQLWDSDRLTADDDLGRIEVSLKELMKDEKSKGKMWNRTDTFKALRAGETMPGRLEWSVGYFTKVRLLDSQVAHKPPKPNITTVEQLKKYSFEKSTKKLREARRDESAEIEQLKTQDFDELCTEMITTSVPSQTYPSGILSVQIHQITGLELESLNRTRDQDGGETEDGEEEGGEGLPDSYCDISINHQKIFKTRVKPKNSKPFFNTGTERFVRDWRSTTVFVAVRDARIHEDNPLLGIVHLQVGSIFRKKGASRFNEIFPLTGGIGYGHIRISVVFRSVQMQPLPKDLGWEWGTLQIAPKVECSDDLPEALRAHRLKFRTPLAKGKMHARAHTDSEEHAETQVKGGVWAARRDIPLRLPVRNRYSVPLVIEFRTSSFLKDSTPAFAILWLQDITDEETQTLNLPVFQGDLERAEANVLPQEEMGEKVGSLKIKVRFWRGLGKWHGRLAKKDDHIAQMMEVLQCARDNGLIHSLVGNQEWLEHQDGKGANANKKDDSSSSDSSDDEGEADDATSSKQETESANAENAKASKSLGGFMDEVRSYRRHKDQLHERHRGIMQWKGPRILNSMMHKAEKTVDRIGSVFEHHDRQPDVETEV